MDTWALFFAWPTGQVWPNLIASLIWAMPVFITQTTLIMIHFRRNRATHPIHHETLRQLIREEFDRRDGETE